MKYDLTPEELGGKTICVEVSATKRIGIDNLLEMLLLEAELLELKADPAQKAVGTVIESRLDKGRGAVATVLVQDGTLKIGDPFVVGHTSGKVRAMINEQGENLDSAPPSTPVEILGFLEVPQAGDTFEIMADEKVAREMALKKMGAEAVRHRPLTLGNLYDRIKAGVKELKIIVKSDVHGSVEALQRALENLSDEKVMIRVIHAATGDVNESDVILASASDAIMVGFNIKVEDEVKEVAEKEGVDIRLYQIIYNALNDVKAAMAGLLEPVYKDVFIGRAEVRQIFNLPNGRQIAGSYVLKGKIVRGARARLLRGSEKIFEGKITSLRRFKNDVHEVAEGYECGLGMEGFNNYREDDYIEAFLPQKVE
jgi:translation initiation factor IF-2